MSEMDVALYNVMRVFPGSQIVRGERPNGFGGVGKQTLAGKWPASPSKQGRGK